MYEASETSSATEARIAFSTILISLFTFLLTFFILLTSQGNFQTGKSKEVLESLQETFTATEKHGSLLVSPYEKNERMRRDEMEQELNAILQRLWMDEKATHVQWDEERGWIFSFPLDRMMEEPFHHLSMQGESLLQEVSQLVKRWHEELPHRMAISLPTAQFAVNNTMFTDIIALMEREHFPSSWLVLGLAPDTGAMMLIELQPTPASLKPISSRGAARE